MSLVSAKHLLQQCYTHTHYIFIFHARTARRQARSALAQFPTAPKARRRRRRFNTRATSQPAEPARARLCPCHVTRACTREYIALHHTAARRARRDRNGMRARAGRGRRISSDGKRAARALCILYGRIGNVECRLAGERISSHQRGVGGGGRSAHHAQSVHSQICNWHSPHRT